MVVPPTDTGDDKSRPHMDTLRSSRAVDPIYRWPAFRVPRLIE